MTSLVNECFIRYELIKFLIFDSEEYNVIFSFLSTISIKTFTSQSKDNSIAFFKSPLFLL